MGIGEEVSVWLEQVDLTEEASSWLHQINLTEEARVQTFTLIEAIKRKNPEYPHGLWIEKCARCAGDIVPQAMPEGAWQACFDQMHKPHIQTALMENMWWHLDGTKGCCGYDHPLLDLEAY